MVFVVLCLRVCVTLAVPVSLVIIITMAVIISVWINSQSNKFGLFIQFIMTIFIFTFLRCLERRMLRTSWIHLRILDNKESVALPKGHDDRLLYLINEYQLWAPNKMPTLFQVYIECPPPTKYLHCDFLVTSKCTPKLSFGIASVTKPHQLKVLITRH